MIQFLFCIAQTTTSKTTRGQTKAQCLTKHYEEIKYFVKINSNNKYPYRFLFDCIKLHKASLIRVMVIVAHVNDVAFVSRTKSLVFNLTLFKAQVNKKKRALKGALV